MESILLTHAEVAVALAGFASVVAAFQRPLAPVQRQRFITLLLSTLSQVLCCLVPALLMQTYGDGPETWRLASQLIVGISLALIAIIIPPLVRLGAPTIITLNLPITALVYVIVALVIGLNVANGFVVETASFTLYYASLILGLCSIFIAFADVATRDD